MAVATIWFSTALTKIYYTKKTGDVIEKHGWPKDANGNLPRSPTEHGPAWINDMAASGSFNYACGGTFATAIGLWFLTPPAVLELGNVTIGFTKDGILISTCSQRKSVLTFGLFW